MKNYIFAIWYPNTYSIKITEDLTASNSALQS